MRLRITLSMLAVVAALAALAPSSAQALGKVKCDEKMEPAVAIGQYDPIVNHNQAKSMHEHQFFGNIAWHSLANPNAANYSDLAGRDNNCRNVMGLPYSADSAGYWVPTLRYTSGPKAGQLVPAKQFTAYYRAYNGATFGEGMPFPKDVRLVATDDAGKGAHGWNCGQFSQQAKAEGTVNYIPNCTGEDGSPGNTLTAHINFPSCWDGVAPNHSASEVGDTRDNAHWAYPSSKGVCPAGFPKKVVQLRETIQFAYTGDGTDVALSSDHPGDLPGESMHADFWNTWMQPEFEQYVATCVNNAGGYASSKCDP